MGDSPVVGRRVMQTERADRVLYRYCTEQDGEENKDGGEREYVSDYDPSAAGTAPLRAYFALTTASLVQLTTNARCFPASQSTASAHRPFPVMMVTVGSRGSEDKALRVGTSAFLS